MELLIVVEGCRRGPLCSLGTSSENLCVCLNSLVGYNSVLNIGSKATTAHSVWLRGSISGCPSVELCVWEGRSVREGGWGTVGGAKDGAID